MTIQAFVQYAVEGVPAIKQGEQALVGLGKTTDQTKAKAASLAKVIQGELTGSLQNMTGPAGRFGNVLAAMGPQGLAAAAGLGAVIAAAGLLGKTLIDATMAAGAHGGKLADLEAKTGIAATALQRLEQAGRLTGNSIEQMASGVTRMQRVLVESPEKFDAIGISASKLMQMEPDQAFARIGREIAGIEDPARRSAAAMELFGKSGAELLPVLTSNLAAAGAEAQRLGLVLGQDTVRSLDAFGDSVDTAKATWEGLWRQIGAAIATSESIQGSIKGITDAIGGLSSIVGQLRETFPNTLDAIISRLQIMTRLAAGIGTFGLSEGLIGLGKYAAGQSERDFLNYRTKGPGFASDRPEDIPDPFTAEGMARLMGGTENYKRGMAQAQQANKVYEDSVNRIEKANEAAVKAQEKLTEALANSAAMAVDYSEALRSATEVEALLGRSNPLPTGGPGTSGMLDTPGSNLTAADANAAWQAKYGAKNAADAARSAKAAGDLVGVSLKESMGTAFKDLPQVIMGAIQGGGGIGKSIGSLFGASLFGPGTGITKAISGGLSSLLGKGVGGALSAAIPGIGAMVGPLIGSLADKLFGGLFGGAKRRAEEERKKMEAEKGAVSQIDSLKARWESFRSSTLDRGVQGLGSIFDYLATKTDVSGERLQRLGRIGSAVFGALFASGMSMVDAADKYQETLAKAEKAGVDITSPKFGSLSAFAGKVSENKGLAGAAEGTAGMLSALRVTGGLTQGTFDDVLAEVAAFRTDLVAAGFEGNQALAPLARTLFEIQQEAARGRVTVDSGTQAMIDQAQAGGLFENLKDPMKEMVEIQKALLQVMSEVAKVFGANIPANVQTALNSFNGLPPTFDSVGTSATQAYDSTASAATRASDTSIAAAQRTAESTTAATMQASGAISSTFSGTAEGLMAMNAVAAEQAGALAEVATGASTTMAEVITVATWQATGTISEVWGSTTGGIVTDFLQANTQLIDVWTGTEGLMVTSFMDVLPSSVEVYLEMLSRIPSEIFTNAKFNGAEPPPGDGLAGGAVNRYYGARSGGHWLNVSEGGRGEYVTVTHSPVTLGLGGLGITGRRVPRGATHAQEGFGNITDYIASLGGGANVADVLGGGGFSVGGEILDQLIAGQAQMAATVASLAAAVEAIAKEGGGASFRSGDVQVNVGTLRTSRADELVQLEADIAGAVRKGNGPLVRALEARYGTRLTGRR